ncbi:MAG: penicillin-binding protein 2 [Candidatus Nanopelagicales bacterium]
MNDSSNFRLALLRIFALSLFFSLAGKLFTLQILDGQSYQAQALSTQTREIVQPALRGLILDQAGRVVVGNDFSLIVSLSKTEIERQDDGGEALLSSLAKLLKQAPETLRQKLTICGTEGAAPAPICWNGSPYQPIPIASDVDPEIAIQIAERSEDFPGVSAEVEPLRNLVLPFNTSMAHILGYLGPVNDDELNQRKGTSSELQRTDVIGRAGLESYYDDRLRGQPGVITLAIDRAMTITGEVRRTDSKPGDYLVLSIDSALQKVVEEQLEAAVNRARASGNVADGAAAVVMDVTNGQVLALASHPTYDLGVWEGGVSKKDYKNLTSKESGAPLISRATQGIFAPASTFKLFTTIAAAKAGFPLGNALYSCPSFFSVGDRDMRNYESSSYGSLTIRRALQVSCNTVFYKFAYDMWLRDGGNEPGSNPKDYIENTALQFGFGKATGIDLPSESSGRIGGRQFKLDQYAKFKDVWCYRAEAGYPDVAKSDPARATYLKALAKENCIDGDKFRGGDAANLAIGQGDTAITPLQLAVAYAAFANGGDLLKPHLVKAIISADGKNVTPIKRAVTGKAKFTKAVQSYITSGLTDVVSGGTAAAYFAGWPQNKIPIAAKTGTGQAGTEKDTTSWMASFAPANKPKYVVVFMVSQGGTGGTISGPSVRKIYEAIFGVRGGSVNSKWSVLAGGKPSVALPQIGSDGSVTPIRGWSIDKFIMNRFIVNGS